MSKIWQIQLIMVFGVTVTELKNPLVSLQHILRGAVGAHTQPLGGIKRQRYFTAHPLTG